jgi:acyl-CoA dehydrogenase
MSGPFDLAFMHVLHEHPINHSLVLKHEAYKKRLRFGTPLSSFQVIQLKLAEMTTRIQAARNLYYEAAWMVDNGTVDHRLVAMAKWHAGETAVKCTHEALQMHGGYGYLDEYKVQKLYRDAKIVEIYEPVKEIEKGIVVKSVLGL